MIGPGEGTQRALTFIVIAVASATFIVLLYIAVSTARTASDLQDSSDQLQREVIALHRAQQHQAQQLAATQAVGLETRRILCDSNLATLVILKSIKNTAKQQGLNTTGIPDHLPPVVEAVCAKYSQR